MIYNVIIIRLLLLLLLQPLLIGYGKKSTKFFSRDRIPHTFPDHEFPSPLYTYRTRGGGEGRRTRTSAFSYRYGPPGSDRLNICAVAAISADRPKVTCLEEKMRFHLDRDYLSLFLSPSLFL